MNITQVAFGNPLVFNNIQCLTILTIYMELVSNSPVNFTMFKDNCSGDAIDYVSVQDVTVMNKTIIDAYQYNYCFQVSTLSNESVQIAYNFNTSCYQLPVYNCDCSRNVFSAVLVTIMMIFFLIIVIFVCLMFKNASVRTYIESLSRVDNRSDQSSVSLNS